ncbi:MAG: hypothetical protein M1347_01075 [Chloroflexi bacterium]|nr:hypothetical protein [Chloroflexota bacterium]
MTSLQLEKRLTQNAEIIETAEGWQLKPGSSRARSYQLAQLDNYSLLSRSTFPHKPPARLSMKARASNINLPGTWGVGFWNDPFGLSFGFGGSAGRLPVFPNAAWFFFASPENHLALHQGLPGNGPMVAVFRSPRVPALLLTLALPLMPFLAWPLTSRLLRRVVARMIDQEAISLDLEPTIWHEYKLDWERETTRFTVDEKVILETRLSPIPPLGLVLWIDNQYAAWPPDGRIRYGTLPTLKDCWVEIKDLHLD